jgi:hypothetical protein
MLSYPIGFYNPISVISSDPYFSNVQLLLKFQGANNSTTFTDLSQNNYGITVGGNTKISTAKAAFGTSSALFDGNGDYLKITNNSNVQLANKIFTLDCFIYPVSPIGSYPLILISRPYPAAWGYAIYIDHTNGKLYALFGDSSLSDWNVYLNSTSVISTSTFTHFAITRSANTTNPTTHSDWKLWINGVLESSQINIPNFIVYDVSDVTIGGEGTTGNFNGYIGGLRITTNVCRYTANFNPNTDTYFDSSSGGGSEPQPTNPLLIHLNPSSYPGSGTTWTDLQGNFNFSLVGGVSFSNGEMVFDGNSGYAQTVSNPSIPSGSSPISLEIYARSTFNRPFVVSKTSPSSETLNFNFSNNQLGLTSTNSGNTDFSVSVSNISNTYYHLVATYDGSFVRLYRNGILVGTSTSGRLLGGNSAPLRLMCFDPSNSPYAWFVNGAIKVFRLYTKALSDAEVLQNYNSIL